jgi:biotin operon repressor
MMKWMVGLLLLANLALFGWMRWGTALTGEQGAGSAQAALNADKVMLLEYLPASAAASASSVAPVVTLPLVAAPAPIPAPAQPAPTPAPATKAAAPAAPAPVTPAAPANPTPVSAAAAVVPPEPVKVAAPVRKVESCAEWGEFSGTDLTRAQEALATLKLGNDLSQRTVELDHGYWVHIPPLKKRTDVDKKVAQLKERGIKDYFVVREKGKWQNAISLGVFKSEEAAKKHLDELRSKGVRSAKIGQRQSKLRYTVFQVRALDTGTEDKLNALQKDFPDSELKVLACED